MTFKEFKEMAYGITFYEIYLNGKYIGGSKTLDSKYENMTITELDFDAEDNGRITCTLELKENCYRNDL